MKTFINKYQIIIFFALTFIFSWFPWYAGIAPEVMAMGPSFAAFIVVFIVGGKHGFLDLLRPFVRWRASVNQNFSSGEFANGCAIEDIQKHVVCE